MTSAPLFKEITGESFPRTLLKLLSSIVRSLSFSVTPVISFLTSTTVSIACPVREYVPAFDIVSVMTPVVSSRATLSPSAPSDTVAVVVPAEAANDMLPVPAPVASFDDSSFSLMIMLSDAVSVSSFKVMISSGSIRVSSLISSLRLSPTSGPSYSNPSVNVSAIVSSVNAYTLTVHDSICAAVTNIASNNVIHPLYFFPLFRLIPMSYLLIRFSTAFRLILLLYHIIRKGITKNWGHG